MSQFASDLANDALPQFSYIVPNIQDDAHNGTPNQADSWLKTNIATPITSSTFQQDGLLIITFDESSDTDTQHGGGQVPAVIISPKTEATNPHAVSPPEHMPAVLQALGVTSSPRLPERTADE